MTSLPERDLAALGETFGSAVTGPMARRQLVRQLFDRVAPRYDLMNDLMSFGLHRPWKRTAAAAVSEAVVHLTGPVVDLAGGTGDLSKLIAAKLHSHPVINIDASPGMIAVAARRLNGAAALTVAEAERLPLTNRSVAAICLSFGLRNMTDPQQALREAERVLNLIWSRGGRFGAFLLGATLLTLFGGYLVKIYAWRTILGREGIVNNSLVGLGITGQPVDALLYSPFAVILVLVSYLLPFTILPLFGALRAIEPTSLDAARDLGASPRRVLLDAVLPRCVPAILTAFALSFLIAAGDYVTPRMVGGTQTMMMGNFIESQFGLRMNVPLGAAMMYSTLITSVAVIAVLWLVLRSALRPK